MCFSVQRTLINIPLSTQCWVLPQFVCCLYYSSSFKHHQWVTVCHLSTKGSLVTGLLQFSPPTHDPRSKFWALSSCLWLHHSWRDTRDVTHMRRCLFHLDTIPSPPPLPTCLPAKISSQVPLHFAHQKIKSNFWYVLFSYQKPASLGSPKADQYTVFCYLMSI